MVIRRPELLARAWALPVAQLYTPLCSQGWSSICGPTSVANVLRSMRVPAKKNPFRKFGVRAMSLDQIANESAEVVPPGWKVSVVRPRSADELRAELRTSNDVGRRYVANFTRVPLFGGGGGHHSPIGGYLEDEDLAFVLDVNRGYGPWLVPTGLLYSAMTTRGLARFER